MKNLLLLLTMLFSLVSVQALAQSKTDQVELTRAVIQTEKKAIIAANMKLTEEESQVFWPVYNDYQNSLNKINDRTVRLINGYAENYEKMTDGKAMDMLNEFLDIEKARLKLKKSYIKNFLDVLDSKKVVRYFQLENKIEAIIKAEIAQQIPLVK